MPSIAFSKFQTSIIGATILKEARGAANAASTDTSLVEQTCLRASTAHAVGCWEGYVEAALREFVAKTRVNAHRKSWTLIAQFEAIVDKMAADLNTPNWDRARELLMTVTGIDPQPSWIWKPKFSNTTDTKNFFEGIMGVRHAFAHGFSVPHATPGLASPGILDPNYIDDATACITFFAKATDDLLEHELKHRHGTPNGWN